MDFNWTDEQLAYKSAVASFASKELNADLADRDANEQFPADSWQKCADLGLLGLPFDEQYGGQGADTLTTMLAMEALGYGCRDNGLIFSINAHVWSGAMPIHRFGTDAQKQKYLPGLCDGSLIGVQGMTEPDSGSDAYSLSTTATADGDDYLLNGSKTFITNAPVADMFIVFATIDRTKGWAGLCAFIVERDTPGLTVGSNFHKMGLRTSPMSELVMDNCRVSADNLVGSVGSGMMVFNHSIEWERACILASAIGTMEYQLEESIKYANARHQFGQPIGKNQAVSHRLVDMKLRIETSRLLLYQLGWKRDQNQKTPMEASLVKYHLSESYLQNSLDALQIHGASGYMTETGLEHDIRDAIASRIYSGTNDIQKNIVAAHLGL
ncbi:MAG: acyl-CoA dehydrogenase family protein [Acidimicrobiia bacterium]